MIYIIGSLRNPQVPMVAANLRSFGFKVFDDWYSAGPAADDSWMSYERERGHDLQQALAGPAAIHTFEWDLENLDNADAGVMVAPAGRSGHLELGYLCGQGKPCAVLLDGEPERWDVMYQFARWGVHYSIGSLVAKIKDYNKVRKFKIN